MTENHLANVCKSPKDKFKAEFERRKRKPQRRTTTKNTKFAHQITEETAPTYSSEDDDYVVHSFSVFAHHDTLTKNDKYYTWLPVSTSPNKTTKVLMQVDSAATCNTLPSTIYNKISGAPPLISSRERIVVKCRRSSLPSWQSSVLSGSLQNICNRTKEKRWHHY